MEYTSEKQLTLDEEFILTERILPTAKRWVMDYPPSDSLHENGLRILRKWQVKDAELRERMARLNERGQ